MFKILAQSIFLLIFFIAAILTANLVHPNNELFTNQAGKVSIKKGVIAILCYIGIMLILPHILSPIFVSSYLIKNGISPDTINPDSDAFDKEVYNLMVVNLNPLLEIIIYSLLTLIIILVLFKEFKEDFITIQPKLFIWSLAGILIVYVGNVLGSVIEALLGNGGTSTNQEGIEQIFNSGSFGLIVTIITTVIMAPIVEELIFRKVVFSFFKNNLAALIASALIFGFIHVMSPTFSAFIDFLTGFAGIGDVVNELFFIISYSLMGLGLGLTYILGKRNLLVSILTHAAINGISILILIFSR